MKAFTEFISLIIMIAIFSYGGVWLVEHNSVGWAIGTAAAIILHNVFLLIGGLAEKIDDLQRTIDEISEID